MTVPFVMTPSDVYMGDCGFFFTPIKGRQNVAFSYTGEENKIEFIDLVNRCSKYISLVASDNILFLDISSYHLQKRHCEVNMKDDEKNC